MNISLVMAVYNNIHLTKKCYERIRNIYPKQKLIISSGGSTDETNHWGTQLNDPYTKFIHTDVRISFSETYNIGVNHVDTEKLVLIHNDIVIGKNFLENLDKLLDRKTILSYLTIEPPIFNTHTRPGKLILDLGDNFENFRYQSFENLVETNSNNCTIYDGACFFMSLYKETYDDIGGFDGKTFFPAFCEDDDFLFRAKLRGYNLKTTECAITYHFVSQTSRFGVEMRDYTQQYEQHSNRNFIRKWGIPSALLHSIYFLSKDNPTYEKKKMCLIINDSTLFEKYIYILEPLFDKITTAFNFESYVSSEQRFTSFDLTNKFIESSESDITIYVNNDITESDYNFIPMMRLLYNDYESGRYFIGNLDVQIKK